MPVAESVIRGKLLATGGSLAMGAILQALAEVGRVSSGYAWKDLPCTRPAGVAGEKAEESLARLSDLEGARS